MYGIAGERRLSESELPWLLGYEGSSPVRIGNAAHEQFQLDVYGEIIDAAHLGSRSGASSSQRIMASADSADGASKLSTRENLHCRAKGNAPAAPRCPVIIGAVVRSDRTAADDC